MKIFNEIAIAICAYSIPHARLEDNPLEQLQTKRTKLLTEYLNLPADIPHKIIQAELGLKDIHAEATEVKLRTIHKIYNNQEDTLTNKMLTWQTRESDPTSTKLAQTAALLTRTGSGYNIQQFLQMPYEMAKKHAKELTNQTNLASYNKSMKQDSLTTRRLLTIKAHWGLERALANCPLYQARTYIIARANALPLRPACDCHICGNAPPTVDATIWLCDKPRLHRERMLADIKKHSPTAHAQITNLQHTDINKATEYLLGNGHHTCPQNEWNTLQICLIGHLHEILTLPT